MTEIMPVPRNLNFTVLPAGGLSRPLFLYSTAFVLSIAIADRTTSHREYAVLSNIHSTAVTIVISAIRNDTALQDQRAARHRKTAVLILTINGALHEIALDDPRVTLLDLLRDRLLDYHASVVDATPSDIPAAVEKALAGIARRDGKRSRHFILLSRHKGEALSMTARHMYWSPKAFDEPA